MSRAYPEPHDLEQEKGATGGGDGKQRHKRFLTDSLHGATAGVLLKCLEADVRNMIGNFSLMNFLLNDPKHAWRRTVREVFSSAEQCFLFIYFFVFV